MLSKEVAKDLENGSATRKMFEEGLKLKKQYGEDAVVDFSLGNPMTEPPEGFNKKVIELMSSGKKGLHRYMPNAGHVHIRDAVASYLNSHGYFKGIKFEHIMMCVGAAGGLNTVLKTILNKGEEVITIVPYFPEYRFYIKNHKGKQVLVDAAEDFNLNIEAIEKAVTKKTRAIILNSPNNPTSVMYPKKNLEDLALMLSEKEKKLKRDIYLISDEPYRELVYEGIFTSPASLYKNSFMVYSWSKSLSLPGERIGYVAVNPEMKHGKDILPGLAFCNRILGFVNAPTMMQHVLPEIINAPSEVAYYKAMHDSLYKCLKEGGYEFVKPQSAFFFWVKCPTPGKDPVTEEKEFIEDVKSNFLLLLVAGSTFGKPGWFRLSYAVNPEIINAGCKKLKDVAAKYKNADSQYFMPYEHSGMEGYCDEGMPPKQKSYGS